MTPDRWIAGPKGASLPNAKCVHAIPPRVNSSDETGIDCNNFRKFREDFELLVNQETARAFEEWLLRSRLR
jgi:hypothetical protein